MDSADEDDWPEELEIGKKFSVVEESLQCPICADFLNNPMVLKCGHTYCSLCIRKHLDQKINKTTYNVCPSCREKAEVFDLTKNSVVSSLVQAYKSLRPLALKLVKESSTSKRTHDTDIIEVYSSERNSASSMSRRAAGIPITRKMAHFSFHGMKPDKVKATLIQVSGESRVKLRLDGTREAMEKRLREFVHLHNSQIDSTTPLSLEDVIRKVNEAEIQLFKESIATSRLSSKLEKVKNGEVVQEVEDNFAKLTRKMREQKAASLKKLQLKDRDSAVGSSQTIEFSNPSNGEPPPGLIKSDTDLGVQLSEEEAESGAHTVRGLNEMQRTGYDWGPWRVVMSQKLARPFFFNTATGIGQFAVPNELAEVMENKLTESEKLLLDQALQAEQRSQEERKIVTELECDSIEEQAAEVRASQEGSQRRWLRSQVNAPRASNDVSSEDYGNSQMSQKSSRNSHNSQSSSRCSDLPVLHGTPPEILPGEKHEESPFHMLNGSQTMRSACSGAKDYETEDAIIASEWTCKSGSSDSNVILTSARSSFAPTAVSTVIDLPRSTPYPVGIAYSDSSGSTGGSLYSDSIKTGNSVLFSCATSVNPSAEDANGVDMMDTRTSDVEGRPIFGNKSSSSGSGSSSSSDALGESVWILNENENVGGGSQSTLFGVGIADRSQPSLTQSQSQSQGQAQKEWACCACTYLNDWSTYSCSMCGTVDKIAQNRFTKPLLRSGVFTSSGCAGSGASVGKSGRSSSSSSSQPSTGKKRSTQPTSTNIKRPRR